LVAEPLVFGHGRGVGVAEDLGKRHLSKRAVAMPSVRVHSRARIRDLRHVEMPLHEAGEVLHARA
jgi:hypothetical protein